MMGPFEDMSYKELQIYAKQSDIPANMQRQVLIKALYAYQNNQLALSKQIVEDYRENRKKRTYSNSNKPQNLSTKRRGKIIKSTARNKDEIIVDSTSRDVRGNDMMYPSSSCGSSPAICDRDNSNAPERLALLNRYQAVSQIAGVPPSESVRCVLPYGTCDNRFNNIYNYGNKFNFSNPCATSTPYRTPLMPPNYSSTHQNPVVGLFQRTEFSSIYNCRGVHGMFRQQSSNFPQNASLPCDAELTNVAAIQNYPPSIYSTSSMSYPMTVRTSSVLPDASRDNSNEAIQERRHEMEIDYPSNLLPNTSQLDPVANNVPTSTSMPWSNNSLLFRESERGVIRENSGTHGRDISTVDISAQIQNIQPAVDNDDDLHAEFDSGSDVDTLSISEDLASFLDWNTQKPAPNNCENENYSHYPLNTACVNQTFTNPCTYNYYPYSTYQNSDVENVKNMSCIQNRNTVFETTMNQTGNLCQNTATTSESSIPTLISLSSTFPGTSQTVSPLPSFNNIFEPFGSNQATGLENQQQSGPREYYQLDNDHVDRGDNTTKCVGTVLPTSPKISMSNNVDLVTPNSSPRGTSEPNVEPSISNLGSDLSPKKNQLETLLNDEPSTTRHTSSIERSTLNSNFAVLLRKAFLENKVVGDSTISNKNGSEIKKIRDSSIKKNEQVPEMRQLIYESETLHRSKIICSIPCNDTELKSGNVRQLLESYLSKDSVEGSKPLAMIKMSSLESNGTQKQIIEKTPVTVIPMCRPCVYQKRGCTTAVKANYAHTHEKKCAYQPVGCPDHTCYWKDSMNLLIRHIFERHKSELKKRNDFVYLIDRILNSNQSIYTFFQLYKEVVYIIQLHLKGDTCIAEVQYIPEIESTLLRKKRVSGTVQLMSFCKRPQVKTWNGTVQPFYEDVQNQNQQAGTIQIGIHDSAFVALRLHVD